MKTHSTIKMLAADLRLGGKAEVKPAKALRGYSPTYMEIDGAPVEVPRSRPLSQPAIVVTLPDGKVSIYLTGTVERARFLLREAERLVNP